MDAITVPEEEGPQALLRQLLKKDYITVFVSAELFSD
jgi:hypothetical protein